MIDDLLSKENVEKLNKLRIRAAYIRGLDDAKEAVIAAILALKKV